MDNWGGRVSAEFVSFDVALCGPMWASVGLCGALPDDSILSG